MKTTKTSINRLTKIFDKELKMRLLSDLKALKDSGKNLVGHIKNPEKEKLAVA